MLAAVLMVATLASQTQAADQPAVLRGVSKKQTLTVGQMRSVRGEGLCGPLLTVAAAACVKVDLNVCAKVAVPCLLDVNANVNVHADVHAFALVKL